jgi:coenzyme F420-reducing hydrogenase beta subunit
VTEYARHLFRKNKIGGALCFDYDGRQLFTPRIAFSAEEYVQSGSIYHAIPLLRFLRESLSQIRSPLLVTCLPCQCRPVRRLLQKHKISSIVISLVCSGQLTKQATYDFLTKHKIDIDEVASFRYRGGGWPAGIRVDMIDGMRHFFHNLDSDWKCFFHSGIYNLNRCLGCGDTYGMYADLSVGDPWFKEYKSKETVGCSAVCAPDGPFASAIEDMVSDGYLNLHAKRPMAEFVACQYWTVAKKMSYRRYKVLRRVVRLFRSPLYRRIFLIGRYRHRHYKLYMKLLKRYRKRLYAEANRD